MVVGDTTPDIRITFGNATIQGNSKDIGLHYDRLAHIRKNKYYYPRK